MQRMIPGFLVVFILAACQRQFIEIPLKLNHDFDQNFGYRIRFDEKLVLDSHDNEVLTGKARGDLLVGYKPVSGSSANINFWIDKDRDGNLNNDLPIEIALGSISENIFVKGRGQLSEYEFPYKVRTGGTLENPYIKITSNYSFDGSLVKKGDTTRLQIWDVNSDGLFDLNDTYNGNLKIGNTAFPDKQMIPINQIITIFNNHYLLDSLPEDMSYIRLKKTVLQPIIEGNSIPDFSIELINGENTKSNDLIGSWVMIDFFGNTRNRYNLQNIDIARDYYNLHKDSIRLISISCDVPESREENIKKLTELDLPWEIGFTEKSSDLWKMFGSSPGCGFRAPFRVLIQPDGKVRDAGRYIGKTWIGQRAPNFTQENLEGETISLSDLKKGKYILLDFWASWCAPCIDEIPIIQKANSLYGEKNLDIIGISWDFSHQEWVEAVDKYNMDWVQLTDLKGYSNQLGQQYGISSIPASVLINPDGIIISKNVRGEELMSVLHKMLLEL